MERALVIILIIILRNRDIVYTNSKLINKGELLR